MPQRYLASANRMPKKEGGARSPSFWTAYIPVPCLPVCSPRKHRGAMRCTPSAWEVLSRPCPLDTSRTPYRTSGLPAGAELSSASKDIIASTNPECPDTFEYNRTTQPYSYTATELQSYMATYGEGRKDHFAVQTVGAITPEALTLKLSCRADAETFQSEQSYFKFEQP